MSKRSKRDDDTFIVIPSLERNAYRDILYRLEHQIQTHPMPFDAFHFFNKLSPTDKAILKLIAMMYQDHEDLQAINALKILADIICQKHGFGVFDLYVNRLIDILRHVVGVQTTQGLTHIDFVTGNTTFL